LNDVEFPLDCGEQSSAWSLGRNVPVVTAILALKTPSSTSMRFPEKEKASDVRLKGGEGE